MSSRKCDYIAENIIKRHLLVKFKKSEESFWITNISNKIVSLRDLNLSIPPMKSMNLLDSRHHSLTKEQIATSITSGSLFAKQKMVVVRKIPPIGIVSNEILLQADSVLLTKKRSAVETKRVIYEELDITDDEFAKSNADFAELDHSGKYK